MKIPGGEKYEQISTESEKRGIPELAEVPAEIKGLFLKLPSSLQDKIFPPLSRHVSAAEPKGEKKSLEEMVAGFDQKTRERYASDCIHQLFFDGSLKEIFLRVPRADLKLHIEQFMDAVWNSRDKENTDAVGTFTGNYYAELRKRAEEIGARRKEILNSIELKQAVVDEQVKRIEVTKKQKRLTERKQAELVPLLAELDNAKNELKMFDSMYGSMYGQPVSEHFRLRGVEARQKRERQHAQAVQIVVAYLDSDEFATVVSENLDTVFSSAILSAKTPQGTRSRFSESYVQEAKELVTLLQNAVASWYLRHQNEESLRERRELTLSDKQLKVVAYFSTLFQSYLRGKKARQASDEDMYTEVAQMKVALNLLSRSDMKTS